MRAFSLLLLTVLCLPATLLAQKGDRKGHEKMDSFVPEDQIPPAPVLQVEDALKSFELASGFEIEAVVAEPLVEKPVALKFDGDGRMWVCEMRGYMPDIDGKGEDIPQGRIVILEDTDHDGAVDKRTVFLDKILLPRAVYLLDDGILYADQASLYFIARNGDKPSGKPIIVDADYAKGGNVEHKGNGLLPGLDNWIYSSKSDRRYRRINGEWVMERTHFRGQWGISQDDFGRLYHNNNSTLLVGDFLLPNTVFGNNGAKVKSQLSTRVGSNAVWPIRVTPGVNRGYINKVNGYSGQDTIDSKTYKLINATGASGFAIYRGDQFPRKAYGTAFVTEPCGNLVKAITISEGDGKLVGDHPYGEKEFLASTDERFRPVDAISAPDGSLYIVDFYHGIIQHKTYVTSYLRDQYISRGLDGPGYGLGRIYRVKATDKPLGEAPKLQSLSAKELVPFLSHANGWWRDTAQRLIVERGDASLQADLTTLLGTPSQPLGQLHALWCLEGLKLLTPAHIETLLNSGEEKLASSALAAARSLPDPLIPGALPTIIDYKPGKVSAIYKARFLADIRSTAASKALIELLKKHDSHLVREAAFAGLKGREAQFLAHNDGAYKQKDFVKWLNDAAAKSTSKVPPRILKGEHLASFRRGEETYQGKAGCISCHGLDGEGLPNLGPPLNESDWVTGSTDRLLSVLLHGLMGPITVNGEKYAPLAAMPGLAQNPTITDQDLADITTYIRQNWDNRAPQVTKATVEKVRAATQDRAGTIYTEADFK